MLADLGSRWGWLLALLVATVGCKGPVRAITTSNITTNNAPVFNAGPLVEMPVVPGSAPTPQKIVIVDVDGLLLNQDLSGLASFGENPVSIFREKLDRIAADRCCRAVVLRINSHGGGVTACDMMAHELASFKQRTGLPVVACLMDVSTGGAYYLACGADVILAHPTTITGGIGVILNLYNMQDAMAQFNIMGIPIKAGNNIDLGSPIKPNMEGRDILQQMADEFHERFRRRVVAARPQVDVTSESEFDGRVFTAHQALERRLVDGIGYLDEAIQMARELGGAPTARATILHRCLDKARTPYDITPNQPLQSIGVVPVSIPGLDRSRLPTFLYLWQPEPTMERLGGR